MAILDRSYRNYSGDVTPVWSRFLVPARYGLADAFGSRLFLMFFLACFVWPLICVVIVYLRYNTEALRVLELQIADLFVIDALTFRDFFMTPQATLAFALALVAGPALVSPDLRNNGLPLYLARPFTKLDYVAGKLTVLALLMSAVTWVPGLLLFALQSALAGGGWWWANLSAVFGMLVGFWIWILVVSLLALALSALVKWKPLARILLLGSVIALAGMGEAFNQIYGTRLGSLLDLFEVAAAVWDQLYGVAPPSGLGGPGAWLVLVGLAVASALLLRSRVRAYEVVK